MMKTPASTGDRMAALHHPAARYAMLLVVGLIAGFFLYGSLGEKPTWAYFTLLVIALIPLGLFLTNRRVVHLFGLLAIGILMAGVYLADRWQETPQEQVLRITNELLTAVERSDYSTFERYLAKDYRWQSMNKQAMMHRVRTSLVPSEARSCNISSARVKPSDNPQKLTVEGNLSASGKFGREDGFFSGTIELHYTRQPDGGYHVTGTKVAWMNGGEVVLPSR
jgi:hypothetical protein